MLSILILIRKIQQTKRQQINQKISKNNQKKRIFYTQKKGNQIFQREILKREKSNLSFIKNISNILTIGILYNMYTVIIFNGNGRFNIIIIKLQDEEELNFQFLGLESSALPN